MIERIAAGQELRRRIRNIVAGSGRPSMRLPRRRCAESPAREAWRVNVAQALTDLRSARPRAPVMHPAATELAHCLVAEMLSVRLQDCYRPIFRTLSRVERQIGTLGRSYAEPWAPPARIELMPIMPPRELPEFLRVAH